MIQPARFVSALVGVPQLPAGSDGFEYKRDGVTELCKKDSAYICIHHLIPDTNFVSSLFDFCGIVHQRLKAICYDALRPPAGKQRNIAALHFYHRQYSTCKKIDARIVEDVLIDAVSRLKNMHAQTKLFHLALKVASLSLCKRYCCSVLNLLLVK